jgi:hypothetical protein
MISNAGYFVSKYHGFANEYLTIERLAVEIAATQQSFWFQF